MQTGELEQADYYIAFNRVIEVMLKGETDPTKIAKELGMTRRKVVDHIEAWKAIAHNDADIKERAQEALSNMVRHYDLIIKEMWAIVDGPATDARIRSTTLKSIADIESKRQETLQKAGLYEEAGVPDQLVDMQIKANLIKEMLKEIATKYPNTKEDILRGINRIFNEHTSVDVVKQVIP